MTNVLDPMMMLEAAKYTDWHVDILKPTSSVVFRAENDSGEMLAEARPMRVPETLWPVLKHLIDRLVLHKSAGDQPSFAFDVGDLRFRGERMRPDRYALRRTRKETDPLNKLNLGGAAELLLDPDFRSGGLILVCGEHGAGKSTTVRAAVIDRLKAYGGYCLTVESPIEVDIEGFHGDGYVEQVDATNTGYAYEVQSAMRKFPAATRSMFLFGEVLEQTAAAELARLVPRGNLVLATIHAKTAEDGVKMLIALAERGGETHARELIGSSLRAVVHQKLQRGKPVTKFFKADDAIRNVISDAKAPLSNLNAAIDAAQRRLSAGAFRSAATGQPRMSL